MTARNPDRSRGMRAVWILSAALILLAPVARAQQPAARAPRPIYRTSQQPIAARPLTQPTIARPVRPTTYPQAMPARRPVLRRLPRTSEAGIYVAPQMLAARPFAPYSFAPPALPASDFSAATFHPWGAWLGARGYFNSFLFGGWPLNAAYWQVPPNEQMLPLGFGMWPACDSASIPGRFWTAGPCFGAGDYSSLATNYQNEIQMESAPQYYRPALEFIVQPGAAPPSAKTQPSQPENKPNMVVCLTDGREMEVSDWWVTEGKFYFIPINGQTQTVDLNILDLQKTIEENESRGRTFILNFTPPDERPALPALPSNQ